MTIKQAIEIIVGDWANQREIQLKERYSLPSTPAVWCARSDTAGSYEVDEEWIGISPKGDLVWAYASGCSCWDGDYSEDTKPTMKEFTLEHTHTPEDWEKMIITFSETKKIQEF